MLTIEDLKIEFYDHGIKEVPVSNVSLHVGEGEILGLVGESGSGKSLSCLAAMGLLKEKNAVISGRVEYAGKDMLTCSEKEIEDIRGREIGFIFQDPNSSLNPLIRIGKQLEEVLVLHDKDKKLYPDRKARAIEALKESGLIDAENIYKMYPHELSGGMKQRVIIAMAIMMEPKLLLADEPTTALDVTVQAQIIELFKKINKEKNTAILFISHDLSLVRVLCDKVVVLKKGEVVESGNINDIYNNPKEDYTKKLIAAIPKVEV